MDIKKVRKIIFERDGNKCFKCPSTTRLTLDHIKPKSKFHYHGIDNIITLCWNCNTSKFTSLLPQNELNEIKKYLNRVNQKFTKEELNEMEHIIKEYYDSLIPKKKEKRRRENWKDIAIPNKDGVLKPWTIYRMRDIPNRVILSV
jgi:hypothetical protein